jgi:phosphotransferase system enzyme I (PtsI)
MAERVLVGAGVGADAADGVAFSTIPPKAPAMPLHPTPAAARAQFDAGAEAARSSSFGPRPGLVQLKSALETLAARLEQPSGEATADEVMATLAVMLRDPLLLQGIKDFMADGAKLQAAVTGAFGGFARKLRAVGGFFAERADDLEALAGQVLAELNGETAEPAELVQPKTPYVLVAEALTPIDVSRLDRANLRAVVCATGSATSHAAIMLRGAGIPAVFGVVGADSILAGERLLVDASSGQVMVGPSEDELEQYRHADELLNSQDAAQLAKVDLGVEILANIGSSSEARAAKIAGADGVGLFRTELLYLGRQTPPELEEQVWEYSQVLRQFEGKRVVARVLDLDLDKPLPFLKVERRQRNADSGELEPRKYADRGFRALLTNPKVLETQLLALALAQQKVPKTDLWVMAPMVVSAAEAVKFMKAARSAVLSAALHNARLPVAFGKVGVMIEVPEICRPGELAKTLSAVDFVSVGTNDLSQYALGLSREDSTADLALARDPRVLSLIESVVAAGKREAKPVGVCGEAAADPDSAELFVELGVSSLSASPVLIPQLRQSLAAKR